MLLTLTVAVASIRYSMYYLHHNVVGKGRGTVNVDYIFKNELFKKIMFAKFGVNVQGTITIHVDLSKNNKKVN